VNTMVSLVFRLRKALLIICCVVENYN